MNIYNPAIQNILTGIQKSFQKNKPKAISVNGIQQTVPYPFPSPTDWRDNWIYFLIVDRFNNPAASPASINDPNNPVAWNEVYGFRQGGNFKGITAQLDYIKKLGAGAIWISPVLKNSKANWQYNYHGYGAQDFLNIDARFSSDGTEATAEQELIELIEQAHARGIYVIMDIVINHAARVFDYNDPNLPNAPQTDFTNSGVINGQLGTEPPIEWLNGFGFPRADWQDNLPPANTLSPDDAVWPEDLQRDDFFRRRGSKLSDQIPPGQTFVKGDFGEMRQLVMEYDATAPSQQSLRDTYGKNPVLNIIITAYQYLIAKFDIDGFRIDTVKYVGPTMVETFGNAIREFALSIGKKNFFTFGEIYDDETTIAKFVGRNTTNKNDGFGIDAALDYPLFDKLPDAIKSSIEVQQVQQVFEDRKTAEEYILSSHGEAGKYFVTFLDNHDHYQRFNHPLSFRMQISAGIAILFCLQGIPCIYYGTEQGLQGTVTASGAPDLNSFESVREALWGKTPTAFDKTNTFYSDIQAVSILRNNYPALKYGRIYFREVATNGKDFGFSFGKGGVIAFSRVLSGVEILIVCNTSTQNNFEGFVIMDIDINRSLPILQVAYSNFQTPGQGAVVFDTVTINDGSTVSTSNAAKKYVKLAPMEVQILIPQ